MKNKYIILIEKINAIQVVRLDGTTQFYEMDYKGVELETEEKFIVVKGIFHYKEKRDFDFMIVKEVEK